MVNESFTFGVSTAGVVVGLAIMLYGVSLTAGEELNAIILAGGVVVLVAFGILTAGVAGLEGDHD